jgi:hypothetical protein
MVSPKYKTAGKGLQESSEYEADLNAESSRERSKRSGLGWQISTNNYQRAAHTEALCEGIRRRDIAANGNARLVSDQS